eukprot:13902013-Alexandrium_andersonii.AAC.1
MGHTALSAAQSPQEFGRPHNADPSAGGAALRRHPPLESGAPNLCRLRTLGRVKDPERVSQE